jgi:hypothetical protein
MKTTVKNAIKLADQIEKKYNELTADDPNFFDQHHDHLRIQMDCAWDEVAELEEYLKNPTKKYGYQHHKPTGAECAEVCMQNLQDTLTYCKAVIDLQTQTTNLPKSIFG